MAETEKKHIAVFASGNGSNYEAIATACDSGRIDAEVVLLVCDRPEARVTERAWRHGTKVFSFRAGDYTSKAEYEGIVADMMDHMGIDLVCLAGYMRIIGDTLLRRYGGNDPDEVRRIGQPIEHELYVDTIAGLLNNHGR